MSIPDALGDSAIIINYYITYDSPSLLWNFLYISFNKKAFPCLIWWYKTSYIAKNSFLSLTLLLGHFQI